MNQVIGNSLSNTNYDILTQSQAINKFDYVSRITERIMTFLFFFQSNVLGQSKNAIFFRMETELRGYVEFSLSR